jgi:NADPH-dependent 2,4-dienoyl-CoA reductase/sulfur reductase-like enzyme
MREFDYIIVGGGLAAASAVDGIREVDVDGSIALLSDESDPPYHRPPLSKEYLQTAEAPRELLFVKPSGWFDDQPGLEFFAGTRVDRLDARELIVTTESGVSFHGSRILLATGGRARSLALPGAGLAGVHTLRTASDAEKIRAEARRAERVALVGAGFIGMELASTLKKMEIDSVVLEVTNRVWAGVLPEAVSGFIQRYFEDRGVGFLLGSPVSALEGAGRVTRVVLEDGDEIGADMVVIGVGLQPNDQLAAEAGLAVRDGIIVDSHCETTAGHIYAAGDVARFPDPVLGELVRTEHWDHARAHGRAAGRNMAGEHEPYDHVSYFF